MSKTTTEMQLVPIEKLVPYVNNARTHSAEQITKLRSSLREFGFVNPILTDRNFNVIAGHGRLLAAKEEKISEVPCVFVDYLTDAQKKAYILADNRFAMDAGWDEELLKIEIEDLQGMDFDVSFTGFDESELAKLMGADESDGQEDNFDVDAELQKPCVSKIGDIWTLGKHKIICGDSTLPETYQKLLGETKVNLVCTDPPYFVALESTSGKIKNDDLNDKDGYKFLKKGVRVFQKFNVKRCIDLCFLRDCDGKNFPRRMRGRRFQSRGGTCLEKRQTCFDSNGLEIYSRADNFRLAQGRKTHLARRPKTGYSFRVRPNQRFQKGRLRTSFKQARSFVGVLDKTMHTNKRLGFGRISRFCVNIDCL